MFVFQDDYRRFIALSTFGFYKGGQLEVNFEDFHTNQQDASKFLVK
jgi:hypothetical protein